MTDTRINNLITYLEIERDSVGQYAEINGHGWCMGAAAVMDFVVRYLKGDDEIPE